MEIVKHEKRLSHTNTKNSKQCLYLFTAIVGFGFGSLNRSTSYAEVRSIDGTGNNTSEHLQGAANTPIIRYNHQATYPDDESGSTMVLPPELPNPRVISNRLSAQNTAVFNARHLSDFVWQWGQFLSHDMDLTGNNPVNSTTPVHIPVPVGDLHFDPLSTGSVIIPFNRSNFQMVDGVRQQVNEVTSYIDASNVYGSDSVRALALRSGQDGLLNMSSGALLPFNNNPNHMLPNDNEGSSPDNHLFLAGDVRANEQPGLTSLHTLFSREHNRLATEIKNRGLANTDEDIYQLARKMVGAQMQAITYREYLPAIFGSQSAPKIEDYNYNPTTDASITQVFSTRIV